MGVSLTGFCAHIEDRKINLNSTVLTHLRGWRRKTQKQLCYFFTVSTFSWRYWAFQATAESAKRQFFVSIKDQPSTCTVSDYSSFHTIELKWSSIPVRENHCPREI